MGLKCYQKVNGELFRARKMALQTNAGFWQNDAAQAHPPQIHLSSKIYEVKYFYNADRTGSYPIRVSPGS